MADVPRTLASNTNMVNFDKKIKIYHVLEAKRNLNHFTVFLVSNNDPV